MALLVLERAGVEPGVALLATRLLLRRRRVQVGEYLRARVGGHLVGYVEEAEAPDSLRGRRLLLLLMPAWERVTRW